jgi:hypothetical protein
MAKPFIEPRGLEEELAGVLDQLDGVYCDDSEQQYSLGKCRDRLWDLFQDIKLSETEAPHG